MSFKFLKSKKFFILAFIIILLAGGFFYWQNQKPTPPEKWDTAEVSQREDYKIIEQDNGLLVKNEKAGLSFELPKGWEFEEDFSSSAGSGGVSFASPEMVTATRTPVIKEGCRLKSSVVAIKTDFKTFKKVFKERVKEQEALNPAIVSEVFDLIKVQDHQSIRREFRGKNHKMYFVRVEIPTGQGLYEVGLDAAEEDKEKCKRQFKKILDTVSIR